MSQLPVNPLQGLIKRAAQSLPARTGAVAAVQERLDRRNGPTRILADISASMGAPAAGEQRKIDVLREAVAGARRGSQIELFAFSADVRPCSDIPEPESNTNLALALRTVNSGVPGATLLISDGRPDNEAAALSAAREFKGVIDVLYIGPESDLSAINFMQTLARITGGTVRTHDLARLGNTQQLLGHIAGLLR